MLYYLAIFCNKFGYLKKYLGCVGRGVLRFWHARYRKPRSNFDGFGDFEAGTGIGGVDII